MNPTTLIPAVDPAPLPGPPWLFHLLWVVTFTLHLLMVNSVLGGSVLSALSLTRRPGPGDRRELPGFFLKVNGWAISFAVTFAIAPLLFMQALYGRFFYTATILMPWMWLGMLGILTLAYYLNYVAKARLSRGLAPRAIVPVQAILFLTIAGIQVAANLLHLQPGRWNAAAANPWSILSDPTFVPRFLHFVLAAIALAGGGFAWWQVRASGREGAAGPTGRGGVGGLGRAAVGPSAWSGDTRFSIQAALAATALQIPVGFWLLFALPRDVLVGFMRGGPGVMAPFGLGILAGIGALVVLALCLGPLAKPRLVRHAGELMVLTAVLMIVSRHQLREAYLAAPRVGEAVVATPQWGVFALFALSLLAAAGATVWALSRAARDRPGPGERAA